MNWMTTAVNGERIRIHFSRTARIFSNNPLEAGEKTVHAYRPRRNGCWERYPG